MPTLVDMPVGGEFVKSDGLNPTRTTLDAVLAMINERRVACGLATKAWSDLYTSGPAEAPEGQFVTATIISTLRTWLVDCWGTTALKWLNTDTHAGGDVTGASALTLLNGYSDILGHSWTSCAAGAFYNKAWLNEIVEVCRGMTHVVVDGTLGSLQGLEIYVVEEDGLYTSAQKVSKVVSEFGNYTFGAARRVYFVWDLEAEDWKIIDQTSQYSMSIPSVMMDAPSFIGTAIRGKFTFDLSNISAGTAKMYLFCDTPLGASVFGGQGLNNAATGITGAGQWGQSPQSVVLGGSWESGYVGEGPLETVSTTVSAGWHVFVLNGAAAKVIVAPTFNYQ